MLDAGPLIISEFMAANGTRLDADGETSDWIEIHNPTDAAVRLEGWYLTDDAGDLAKWQFPAVSIDPHDYRIVFASGKDRTDPSAELHANFQLDAGGDSVALVMPDGTSVAHAYWNYPRQLQDVSYGVTAAAAGFQLEPQRQTYRVPTADDAALGTSWMTPDFDDSAWTRVDTPSRVLITEAGTDDDFVEIQNLSDGPVDTSGWVVAVNDAGGRVPSINNMHATLWELPASIAASEVLHRHDNEADPEHYWGEGIVWRTLGPGWVMIVDDRGRVADFVVWGYSLDEIASLAATVNGFDVTAAEAWHDAAVPAADDYGLSLQRGGNEDRDDASDWGFVGPVSMGHSNVGLESPFPDPPRGGIGFDVAGGGLGEVIQTDVEEEMHNANASLWTRVPFQVSDLSVLETLQLRIAYNDGFAAYVNGHQIASRNAPELPEWNAAATDERSVEDSLTFESIDVTEGLPWLAVGENVLAVHALNFDAADGDFLILPELSAMGRRYFAPPSPRDDNGVGYRDFVRDTKFSVDRGFYDGPVAVEITTDTPGATIRYTTDGSPPTESGGTPYVGPVSIATNTVLRAAAFQSDFYPSNVDSHTYLIGATAAIKSLPVISLVADPDGTFSVDSGLWSDVLLRGREAEYPVSFEVIRSEDNFGLQQDAGIRLQGSSYRRRTIGPNPDAKWSFKVYFRNDYDDQAWLNYPLIERSSVDRYKSLTLRGGYNDPSNPFIKDELGRRLQKDMGSLASEGTFVNLLINGQLKNNGYYNPAERHEEHLFQEKYESNLPWDVVTKWQPSGTAADPPRTHDEPYYFDVRDGDEVHFAEMLDYAVANDLAQDAHYREMARRMDVAQFIDYLILQGYARIRDWPQNNWNAARERSDGELGKWRFYAWDLEFGWGSSELTGSFKTPGSSSTMPLSILYENLVDHAEFRQLFADRAGKHFFNGGALTSENVRMRFEELRQAIFGVLPNMNTYIRDTFAPQRPGYVLSSMVSLGLFTFEGPRFRINGSYQSGGQISPGDQLSTTNPHGSGTVYYTLDGSDPRLPGGDLSPLAEAYSGAITLSESVVIKARTLDDGTWSALHEAEFFAGAQAAADNLVISELNYHPQDPTSEELAAGFADQNDFEFIELYNTGNVPIDLTGVEFTEGIQFDFAAGSVAELGPGQFAVVVGNQAAFAERYDDADVTIAGEYSGRLDNGGETIRLIDFRGQPIADFAFNDRGDWPGRADGNGSSLELIAPASVPQSDPQRTLYLEDGNHWRSSSEYGGSPGSIGTGPIVDVVINEVLSHTDEPLCDAIELHNTTGGPIEVGGWYLSDSSGNYRKFRITTGTTIPGDGYLVFDEDDFNPTPLNPGPNHFALDGAHGEDVWLVEADAMGNLTRFVDHVEFPAAANGESFGRWPNATGDLYPMVRRTLDPGGANSGPRVGPLVISEVHYNPDAEEGDEDLEFVEIYNPTAAAVDLTDWRIRQGIDYDFPGGLTLVPHGALVVVRFDPNDTEKLTAFRDRYGIDDTVAIVGGYSGRLSDEGEKIQLQRPDEPPVDQPHFIPRPLEDEVLYDDAEEWPIEADGTGLSLHRTGGAAWGNAAASWIAMAPTPGAVPLLSSTAVVGRHVFYNNSWFDGHTPGAGGQDDGAVAADKEPLLPGNTASFANYTSFSRGINGMMIDIVGLPDGAVIDRSDFLFRVGNDEDPDRWANAPDPALIGFRPNAGTDGSDRVTIIFNDGAIEGCWLQVTVRSDGDLGLTQDDVFYFGNAVGESGDTPDEARVNPPDVLLARNNPRSFLNPAPIDFVFDYNRDARVNATDMLIGRANQTSFLDALKLITVPLPAAATDSMELAWLHELTWIDQPVQPAEKHGAAANAIDKLILSPP